METTATVTDHTETKLDPRTALLAAMELATDTLVSASGADPQLPTPCDLFNVEGLLQHMLAVGDRIAAMGEGRSATSVPAQVAPATGETYEEHWRVAHQRAQQTWPTQPIDAEVEAPWTVLSVAQAAGIYVSEILVHCWDLAVAVGGQFDAEDSLVAIGSEALASQLPVEGRAEMWAAIASQMPAGIDWHDPFAEAETTPNGASALEGLVALSGRSPSWTASRPVD